MSCPWKFVWATETHIFHDMLICKNEASLYTLTTVSFILTLNFSRTLLRYFPLLSSVHPSSSKRGEKPESLQRICL